MVRRVCVCIFRILLPRCRGNLIRGRPNQVPESVHALAGGVEIEFRRFYDRPPFLDLSFVVTKSFNPERSAISDSAPQLPVLLRFAIMKDLVGGHIVLTFDQAISALPYVHNGQIKGAPQHLVGGDIVGARHPHRAAAGLPRVVLVLTMSRSRVRRGPGPGPRASIRRPGCRSITILRRTFRSIRACKIRH
jgi:hypothetical protein